MRTKVLGCLPGCIGRWGGGIWNSGSADALSAQMAGPATCVPSQIIQAYLRVAGTNP